MVTLIMLLAMVMLVMVMWMMLIMDARGALNRRPIVERGWITVLYSRFPIVRAGMPATML